MGLDMWFYKKTYVKNYDFQGADELHQIEVRKAGKIREDIKPERIAYIVEEVGYFRKFNALHGWILNNSAEGNEPSGGGEITISMEVLRELVATLDKVSKILAEAKVIVNSKGDMIYEVEEDVSDIFPPTEGFFFGSQGIDEYYKECVNEAVIVFKNILDDLEQNDSHLTYHASW